VTQQNAALVEEAAAAAMSLLNQAETLQSTVSQYRLLDTTGDGSYNTSSHQHARTGTHDY